MSLIAEGNFRLTVLGGGSKDAKATKDSATPCGPYAGELTSFSVSFDQLCEDVEFK